jgi:hypothetical protein
MQRRKPHTHVWYPDGPPGRGSARLRSFNRASRFRLRALEPQHLPGDRRHTPVLLFVWLDGSHVRRVSVHPYPSLWSSHPRLHRVRLARPRQRPSHPQAHHDALPDEAGRGRCLPPRVVQGPARRLEAKVGIRQHLLPPDVRSQRAPGSRRVHCRSQCSSQSLHPVPCPLGCRHAQPSG